MPSFKLDENLVLELVESKIITETFRRLDPAKKARIYQTAIKLLAEYGYDGLAIDQLCSDASISKGSFFQYFPSKSHLFEFSILVFDNYLHQWVTEIRKNETSVFVRDRLSYLYQALVINSKLYKEEERFYLYLTSSRDHATVVIEGLDPSRHFQEYINDIIERGVETGEVRSDFRVDLTGYLVTLIIEGLIRRQFTNQILSRREMGDYLISFLFDGIKS